MPDRYPGWRYHPTEDAKIIHSEEEDKALHKDWRDEPYSDEEKAEFEEADDAEEGKGAKPKRHEYKTAKEFKAAVAAWEEAE